jgi:hypothetical protein
MRAALEAVEAGVDFAEGHEIDAARSALVPPERLERLLSIEEANRLTTIPRQDHRAAQWLSLRRRGDRLDAGLFVMGNDRLTASLGIFTSRTTHRTSAILALNSGSRRLSAAMPRPQSSITPRLERRSGETDSPRQDGENSHHRQRRRRSNGDPNPRDLQPYP